MRDLIHAHASGHGTLRAILGHQRQDFPNWGNGKFLEFLSLAGLDLDRLALANVAWCATSGDTYPTAMLRHCMRKHTGPLLGALAPDVVILSGSAVHRFRDDVKRSVPNAKIRCTLHYAHRKGRQATQDAATALQRDLSRALT